MIEPHRTKSVTRYPPGPIISAFTWWVGIKKEFDVEIATVRANTAGLAPAATAIETASGTSKTVAPTFDIISVKIVAMMATPICSPQTGQPSNKLRICWQSNRPSQ